MGRTSITSHLWEGALVVCTAYVTQRKRDQTQNKTQYKEGEYVGDSDNNSSGQQVVHSLGCARQDQRLRYQLPPVRPQGFQVRRCQGDARMGQVPRFHLATAALTQAFAQRQTVRLSV